MERNRSVSSPPRLAAQWALWCGAAIALQRFAPRALATFALLYGGWHIFRQNYGFLRELAGRAGLAGDRLLRRLDLLACAAPAVALWGLVFARGPWTFIAADVYPLALPRGLLVLLFAAVPATVILREGWIGGRRASSRAGLLLLGGNAVALLAPALLLDDLTLIYTLSASYHGFQYLAYLVERERARLPDEDPTHVLLPLASAIVLAMLGWFAALAAVAWIFSPALAGQALMAAWYAIVPFHYFVDGRIWRRPRARRRELELSPAG